MILIYHKDNKVVDISNSYSLDTADPTSIAGFLVLLAKEFPDEILVWCHVNWKAQLDLTETEQLFHHKKILVSYNPSNTPYLDKSIGYVEESPFIKINKAVAYPTWQMSSWVGGMHSEVLLAFKNDIPLVQDFDYFLCSLAKLGMQKGLFCYSEPKLLKQKLDSTPIQSSRYALFRFVKQHYRTRWVFLLLFNLVVYERKFPILPFFFSLFYKNRNKSNPGLDNIKVKSSRKVVDSATVDVIIPTIGRKEFLYEILKDLQAQTHLPTNVIVVEQNPDEDSLSELDYLTAEAWPFAIKHTFTHQVGACNARNIALEQISSEWVFFADDDIRIETDFIQKTLDEIKKYGVKAVSVKCFQKGNHKKESLVFQWTTFGAGCSLVFADGLKECKFKMGYEFGFGEDGDFGMQIRNQGHDILYLPEPSILHLKAPIGGFRTKSVLQWQNESIQPKPSPTIMLYQILQNTEAQTLGYKTILFFKYYKLQKIKNPIRYYIHFQKKWNKSIFWANQLKQQNEI